MEARMELRPVITSSSDMASGLLTIMPSSPSRGLPRLKWEIRSAWNAFELLRQRQADQQAAVTGRPREATMTAPSFNEDRGICRICAKREK